jgi:hypothetical protein
MLDEDDDELIEAESCQLRQPSHNAERDAYQSVSLKDH